MPTHAYHTMCMKMALKWSAISLLENEAPPSLATPPPRAEHSRCSQQLALPLSTSGGPFFPTSAEQFNQSIFSGFLPVACDRGIFGAFHPGSLVPTASFQSSSAALSSLPAAPTPLPTRWCELDPSMSTSMSKESNADLASAMVPESV